MYKKHLTVFEIWKTACLLGKASQLTVIMHMMFWATAHISMQVLRIVFPDRLILFSGTSIAWSYSNKTASFGVISKARYTKLLTYNSEFRSVFKGSPFLSRLLECTEWRGSHICTVLITVNSQWGEIYLSVLIELFQFALKCYFISKTIGQFWLTLNFFQNFKTMWNLYSVIKSMNIS